MDLLAVSELESTYANSKEKTLFDRWITYTDIAPLFSKLSSIYQVSLLGTSENNTPIRKIQFGTGKKKILIWSQMHGNESTGTKAVFDLLNYIEKHKNDKTIQKILKNCTLVVVPMLNPDGALAYTRVNANGIDLNRDAVHQQAKESKLLRSVLDKFNPHFCFNLHDQRTIFGVEGTKKPATISFLAPSEEETRKITSGRKETMNVIIAMNNLLQQIIPNSVGRYTDEFYPTATGDNFQKLGHNTVLIEAGHYHEDYSREIVRKLNFYALLQGIFHVANEDDYKEYKPYFEIPNNQKNFFDVIHRNKKTGIDTSYQFKNKIVNGMFTSVLEQEKKGDLSMFLAHKEIFKK